MLDELKEKWAYTRKEGFKTSSHLMISEQLTRPEPKDLGFKLVQNDMTVPEKKKKEKK